MKHLEWRANEGAGSGYVAKIIKAYDSESKQCADYERETLDLIQPPIDEEEEEEEGIILPDPAEILAEARQEAELKIQEAYAEGLRRGTEAGEAQGLAAFEESVGQAAQTIGEAVSSLREARESFLETLEPEVLSLAIRIATQVLRREIRSDPELVRSTVRAALEHLADRESMTIRVNSRDLEVLREHNVTLLDGVEGAEHLEVLADESIESGGCVVESESVHVDATVESQLQRIIDALLE